MKRIRKWLLGAVLAVAVLAAAKCGDVGVSCSRAPDGAVT